MYGTTLPVLHKLRSTTGQMLHHMDAVLLPLLMRPSLAAILCPKVWSGSGSGMLTTDH